MAFTAKVNLEGRNGFLRFKNASIDIFQYAVKVKALIDAGTCATVSTQTICGNSSKSYAYYETFVYKTYRVVIISGVPSHDAEYGQTQVNPNSRCK